MKWRLPAGVMQVLTMNQTGSREKPLDRPNVLSNRMFCGVPLEKTLCVLFSLGSSKTTSAGQFSLTARLKCSNCSNENWTFLMTIDKMHIIRSEFIPLIFMNLFVTVSGKIFRTFRARTPNVFIYLFVCLFCLDFLSVFRK